ncbi:MAG: YigZ family protein [Clostridiales bacterium]|nr:YigZ family protein [Clostridiales bacterium]
MGYLTIKEFAEASFVERHSQFIGYIIPVKTNDEAVDFINQIRAKHRKATHNVYAYVLRHNNITRYSDDGEPQGTAGVPVLDVLQKKGLVDVCCVVTRYFGGVLLGGGGLVRAYSHSAKIAIEAAKIMDMCESYKLRINVDYNMYGKVTYILPEFEVRELSSEFTDNVSIELLVKKKLFHQLQTKLIDATNNQIEIILLEEAFEDFS